MAVYHFDRREKSAEGKLKTKQVSFCLRLTLLYYFQTKLPLIMQTTIVENVAYKFSQICNSAIDPMWLIRVEGECFYYENINASFTQATGCHYNKILGRC